MLTEDRLRQLLQQAAPLSPGVEAASVRGLGRRFRRRRAASAGAALAVLAAAGSLIAVTAGSGSSDRATLSPRPADGTLETTTLEPVSGAATNEELRRDAAVLQRRLDTAGIKGRVEVTDGFVTLGLPPSASDSAALLARTGRVSFRIPADISHAPFAPAPGSARCLTASGPSAGSPPACISAQLSAGCPTARTVDPVHTAQADDWLVACDTTGTVAYALGPEEFGGSVIADARATVETDSNGRVTGPWIVKITFTRSGQQAWTDLTEAISSTPGCPQNQAPKCALAVEVDGVVLSAPIIEARIPGPAEISGSFSEQSAQALAATLSSGSLPEPLKIVRS